MSFEAEWAAAKQGAASMSLASAGDGGGWADGDSGTIRSDKAAWNRAGQSLITLRGHIKKSLSQLEDRQAGTGTGGGEVLSGKAAKEVHTSWQRYLDDVSRRCGELQEFFEKFGNDQEKNDQAIKSSLSKMAVKDGGEDASASSGQSKGW
ncbi:hypothetical protein RCO28_36260 [Streptomyces sp. LHD-70]|uniref:hypothetical protein n=1 Tax=Streptomyces sp. LHD-70 TaxID=3072140 RepID=UPI00280CF7F4|nr:hypothetical protein [Streptomyces sp. LHD-70]MDQ8707884.1 hypothetical protein [Streptomyces sp. LHD-70]